MKKGLLIIFSGPSGVGKGTIRRKVMQDDTLELSYSVSMTTRLPRNKEVEGVDYFFVTREKFDENLANGNLLEHCEFVGNCYGTPKDKVEELRNQGKNVFLEIEVNGATQVLSKVKDSGVVSIFLMPPSLKDLENRIRGRKSETEEVIKARLEKARSEIALKDNYQYCVVNDRITRAAKEVAKIIKQRIKENQ